MTQINDHEIARFVLTTHLDTSCEMPELIRMSKNQRPKKPKRRLAGKVKLGYPSWIEVRSRMNALAEEMAEELEWLCYDRVMEGSLLGNAVIAWFLSLKENQQKAIAMRGLGVIEWMKESLEPRDLSKPFNAKYLLVKLLKKANRDPVPIEQRRERRYRSQIRMRTRKHAAAEPIAPQTPEVEHQRVPQIGREAAKTKRRGRTA